MYIFLSPETSNGVPSEPSMVPEREAVELGNVMGRTILDVRGGNESANEKVVRTVLPSGG